MLTATGPVSHNHIRIGDSPSPAAPIRAPSIARYVRLAAAAKARHKQTTGRERAPRLTTPSSKRLRVVRPRCETRLHVWRAGRTRREAEHRDVTNDGEPARGAESQPHGGELAAGTRPLSCRVRSRCDVPRPIPISDSAIVAATCHGSASGGTTSSRSSPIGIADRWQRTA